MHVRDAVKTLEPYRPGKTIEDVRHLGLEAVIKLGSNENPLGPAPEVMEVIRRAEAGIRLYPESSAPRLRRALAEFTGHPAEHIIAGAGIDELLDLTLRCILEPGDNIVIAFPGFIRYEIAARLSGGEVRRVPGPPEAPFTHDLPGMLRAVDARTRAVVLVNPNNPTGSYVSKREFEAFLNAVPEHVLTILDEAYFEFVRDADPVNGFDYIDGTKPLLVFRTFSKIHSLAGLRVGYGLGPRELIGYLKRAHVPFSVNVLAQDAAIAALRATEHVVQSRELAHTETEFLGAALGQRGWRVFPTQTNFVFAESPHSGGALAEGLMRRGFILRPLTQFGLGDRWFRVSHGTREQNLRFLTALAETTEELGK
ncbi:MAG TPA: histidinol-phosphate transaminase [Candidatus Eisenbacteria bacterium]|nr:histidinol-phosphate transaminase [Candidatus Eisenbacteria bacterium]